MKKILVITIAFALLAILGIFIGNKYSRHKTCETETNTYRKTLQNSSGVVKYSEAQIDEYAKTNFKECMGGYKQYKPLQP